MSLRLAATQDPPGAIRQNQQASIFAMTPKCTLDAISRRVGENEKSSLLIFRTLGSRR